MKKFFRGFLVFISILSIVYLFGPQPSTPVYDKTLPGLPADPVELEAMIQKQEQALPVKPENEARIVWANDSVKKKMPYCIVYLHGFSASQEEGAPIHRNIAQKFGCNLYLARLYGHGLTDTVNALRDFTVDKYWETCKQALVAGKRLGEKVILMSTSTGGTAALKLAAEYPDDVAALILMSPNIAINDPNAWLLNNHWGRQIAETVKGGKYIYSSLQTDIYKKYWYHKYSIAGAVELEELVETSMTKETFQKVKQPVLLLYYYKDEANQDPVVKVSAMKEMFGQLSSTAKREFAVPEAGNHVLGSHVISKDLVTVENRITDFMKMLLGR